MDVRTPTLALAGARLSSVRPVCATEKSGTAGLLYTLRAVHYEASWPSNTLKLIPALSGHPPRLLRTAGDY